MVALTALIEGMTIGQALNAAGLSYGPREGAGYGVPPYTVEIRDEAGHLRATWRASDVVAWARVRRDAYGTPPPALDPCPCVLP